MSWWRTAAVAADSVTLRRRTSDKGWDGCEFGTTIGSEKGLKVADDGLQESFKVLNTVRA